MRHSLLKTCLLILVAFAFGVPVSKAQDCSSCAGTTLSPLLSEQSSCSSCTQPANTCSDTGANSCAIRSPHCFKGIGGGRNVFKSIIDSNYTNTFSFYAGFSSLNDDADDVFAGAVESDGAELFGFEIGRRHSGYLRSAFDFTFRNSDITDLGVDPLLSTSNGDVDVFSVMKNFYVDFARPCKDLNPYVGFGLGLAIVDYEGDYLGVPAQITDDVEFAYQLMAGLDYKIQSQASVFAEYRFFGTGDEIPLESAGAELNRGSYSSHDVIFGLRFGY